MYGPMYLQVQDSIYLAYFSFVLFISSGLREIK